MEDDLYATIDKDGDGDGDGDDDDDDESRRQDSSRVRKGKKGSDEGLAAIIWKKWRWEKRGRDRRDRQEAFP